MVKWYSQQVLKNLNTIIQNSRHGSDINDFFFMTMKTTRGKVVYMLRLCKEHRTTVFLPFFDRDSLVL